VRAFWSRGGDLAVEILQWLSESENTEEVHKGRTVQTLGFNFTIIPDQSGSHLFGDNRERDGISREMEAILSLLTVIRKGEE